jgi:SAM-dependent methyltransferase
MTTPPPPASDPVSPEAVSAEAGPRPAPPAWDDVYRRRGESGVSWFEPVPETSLRMLHAVTWLPQSAPLIDAGGGASRLVDHLLEEGFTDLTLLDLSAEALALARARLGPRAGRVQFIAADLLAWTPPRRYAFWHDRALFHFLTTPEERARYGAVLEAALAPEAAVVIATFAPEGPERCSGRPVQRHTAASLAAALGPRFELMWQERTVHLSPQGNPQPFQYALFRYRSAGA